MASLLSHCREGLIQYQLLWQHILLFSNYLTILFNIYLQLHCLYTEMTLLLSYNNCCLADLLFVELVKVFCRLLRDSKFDQTVSAKALCVVVSGMARHYGVTAAVVCSTLCKFFTLKRFAYDLLGTENTCVVLFRSGIFWLSCAIFI